MFNSRSSRDTTGFEEDKRVLQIPTTHEAIVPDSLGRKRKEKHSRFYVGNPKRPWKIHCSLWVQQPVLNRSCNNRGCPCVCACACVSMCVRWGESVGIKVIMLLINAALWLPPQQRSGSGFLLLRWTRQVLPGCFRAAAGLTVWAVRGVHFRRRTDALGTVHTTVI